MKDIQVLNKDMENFISFFPDIRNKVMYIILDEKYTLEDLEAFQVKNNNIKMIVSNLKKIFLIKDPNFYPFFRKFDKYLFIEAKEFSNFIKKHKEFFNDTIKKVENMKDELEKEKSLGKILKKVEKEIDLNDEINNDFLNMRTIEYIMD